MIQTRDYPIVFETAAFLSLKAYLTQRAYHNIWVLVDENTAEHCLPILKKALDSSFPLKVIQIQSGEPHKTLETCQTIWTALLNGSASRKSVLLNLGGGVIGDMGGFCAATFKRGMDFIQIPTTLLSEVDASVGGKLGIDYGTLKNTIGLFQNPQMVCVHSPFLKTLPERERYSGFAEVIKHALIADATHWQKIQQWSHLNEISDWNTLIAHSINIKYKVVLADPKEAGLRKILNFGHTIGHAIESLSWAHAPLLHGEAIAIGMHCEAYLSYKTAGLSKNALDQISRFLLKIYPPYPQLLAMKWEDLLNLMQQDKKNTDHQIAFSLIEAIGKAKYNQFLDNALIRESLNYYLNLIND